MSSQTPCPISDVDRALASYIHSRYDTLRIRRALSKYLISALKPANSECRNQHLSHECPHNVSVGSADPQGLKDSRLEYLQTIRARNVAQAKHRNLQASLEELRKGHADENPTQPESEYDNEVTRGYISLLRQRRYFAELQVIQESLEKLLSAKPSNAHSDPKDLVKSILGEQPGLPAERLEQLSQAQGDQAGILKLKQEVLGARTAMERAQAAREKAQDECGALSSLQGQVYALERARDEIVEWVQGELAKMEEDSIFLEDASPVKRTATFPNPIDIQSAEMQIRESYNHYTTSRSDLLNSHKSLQFGPQVQRDENEFKGSAAASEKLTDIPKISLLIAKLLPHLPRLSRISKNKRSLLQQSVYLQTQTASADHAMEESLLRLSGESHLLPAGSKVVTAWGKTANEAETATARIVKEQLQESQQEISSVSTAVEMCSLQSQILAST